ncbi:hypothetical protein KCP74_21780 [Salmonella enterica subsp. enterica]|nr:hypothetical protein KCP74_21780 [Salmonella enterica subsp. enterica]
MAYTIPTVIIVGGCWFAWRHRSTDDCIDYFAVSLRLIGRAGADSPLPAVWRPMPTISQYFASRRRN